VRRRRSGLEFGDKQKKKSLETGGVIRDGQFSRRSESCPVMARIEMACVPRPALGGCSGVFRLRRQFSTPAAGLLTHIGPIVAFDMR
jgi:hypothetical protein